MKNLGRFFVFVGISLLFFGVYLLWQRNNPQRLAFKNEIYLSNSEIVAKNIYPVEIKIDSVEINLPIIGSKITNNKWETTTKGVSYLSSSPVPGETGNSILYGHNWKNLLGNLIFVKPSQDIEIVYNDGSKKTFVIGLTQEVTPDQTYILGSTADSRITIYTCSGMLDKKRFVAVAFLPDSIQ